ncbi:MAG: hypothetical protein ACYDD0_03095 [Candidatus Dormibacteria bacterium]
MRDGRLGHDAGVVRQFPDLARMLDLDGRSVLGDGQIPGGSIDGGKGGGIAEESDLDSMAKVCLWIL